METLTLSTPEQDTKFSRALRFILGVAMLLAALVQPVEAYAASKEVPITSVSLPTTITIKVGESRKLNVTVNPSRTTYRTSIQWGVQSNGFFTNKVHGFGTYWNGASSETITGKKPGRGYLTTTVRVYDSAGRYIRSYTLKTTVIVVSASTPTSVALQKITLNRSSLSMSVNSTARLTVSFTPTNTTVNRSVTWTSSNSSVASVSNGTVTAKKAGTATITARVGNRTATCRVTVSVPLQSIKLNKTSITLTVGQSERLTLTLNPSNASNVGSVTWTSSNNSIATVSNGTVTAKKAGTVTITAKVGGKTVTCRVTVRAKNTTTTTNSSSKPASNTTTSSNKPTSTANNSTQKSGSTKGTYRNVSDAYTYLNNFRTTRSNQWYWNTDNRTRTYTYGLQALRRDPELERTAQLRAQEAWTQYYVNGRLTHDRPNGSSCFTAYPSGGGIWGENLAFGQTSAYSVIMDGNYGWAETSCYYSGQGHRRNMLDSRFTRVGIACYEQDGKTCWAMCLGA